MSKRVAIDQRAETKCRPPPSGSVLEADCLRFTLKMTDRNWPETDRCQWFGSVCVMSFNVGPQTSTRVDKCVHRMLLVSTLKKNLSKPMTIQSSVKTEGTTVTQLMWFHSCYIHTLLSFIPSNLTFSYLFPLPTPFSSFLQIFLFSLLPSFLPSHSFPSLSLFILP